MRFTTKHHRSYTVVGITGRLDMAGAPALREAVAEAVARDARRVVLDLGGVKSMDSSGLGELIGCLEIARRAGGELWIAPVGPRLQTALELTHMHRALPRAGSPRKPSAMAEPAVHRTRRGPATPDTLEAVHDDLEILGAETDFVPEEDRMAFTLAVVEAVTNVVVHAVPVDGQALELALEITVTPRRLLARVYEINAAPTRISLDGSATEGGLAESGRGLTLIQSLVSTVAFEHRDGTNVWTLCRDCPPDRP